MAVSLVLAVGMPPAVIILSSAEPRAEELAAEELAEMEQLLAELNFHPGDIDGVVDDRTRTAIRLYQEFAVLPLNGQPSAPLLRELRQVSRAFAEMQQNSQAGETAAAAPAAPEPDRTPAAAPEEARAPNAEAAVSNPSSPPEPAVAEIPPEVPPEEPTFTEPPPEGPTLADAPPEEPTVADTPPREPSVAEAPPEEIAVAEAPPAETAVAEVPPAETAVAELPPAKPATAMAPPAETTGANVSPEAPLANEPMITDAPLPRPKPPDEPAPAETARTVAFNLEGMIAKLKQRNNSATPAREPTPALAAATSSAESAPLASIAPQAAAINVVPGNGYASLRAAYSAAQAGDFAAAIELYNRAIGGGDLALEHLAGALYNRANAHQILGNLDAAIEDYSAAIANKPGFSAAYYNRGFALNSLGERGRAVADFRQARDLGLQRLGVRSPDLPPPLL